MCELLIHEAVCYLLLFSTVIEDNEIVYRDYVDISVAVATTKVCNVAFTLITLMRPFDGLPFIVIRFYYSGFPGETPAVKFRLRRLCVQSQIALKRVKRMGKLNQSAYDSAYVA